MMCRKKPIYGWAWTFTNTQGRRLIVGCAGQMTIYAYRKTAEAHKHAGVVPMRLARVSMPFRLVPLAPQGASRGK